MFAGLNTMSILSAEQLDCLRVENGLLGFGEYALPPWLYIAGFCGVLVWRAPHSLAVNFLVGVHHLPWLSLRGCPSF